MKFKMIISAVMAIFMLLSLSCSEENSTQPPQNQPSNIPMSKFGDIQQKVFAQSCALSNCHGSINTQANLLLTDGNAYSNLVNVQSVLFPQFIRVSPDSSLNSLLIKILKGEVAPQMPLNRAPLDAAVIDSIAKWIDLGALNN